MPPFTFCLAIAVGISDHGTPALIINITNASNQRFSLARVIMGWLTQVQYGRSQSPLKNTTGAGTAASVCPLRQARVVIATNCLYEAKDAVAPDKVITARIYRLVCNELALIACL
jgi:hypothetical protein